MSEKTLCYFEEHGALCYAIPSYESGKAQPADVCLFGSFKHEVYSAIGSATDPYKAGLLNILDFARMITSAFYTSFTRPIIISSFRRSGVCPLDSTRLLNVSRLKSVDEPYKLISVDELEKLIVSKRRSDRRRILGEDVNVTRIGFIDTENGALVNSKRALKCSVGNAVVSRFKKLDKEITKERRVLRDEKKRRKMWWWWCEKGP